MHELRVQFDRILSVEDFKQTVKELEDEFTDAAEQLYQYSDELLKYLVHAGRISQEDAQGIRAEKVIYAPLYRLIDQEASIAQGLRRSAFQY